MLSIRSYGRSQSVEMVVRMTVSRDQTEVGNGFIAYALLIRRAKMVDLHHGQRTRSGEMLSGFLQ